MRLLGVFIILSLKLSAQNWEVIGISNFSIESLYTDSVSDRLIIGGTFSIMNGDLIVRVAQWDGFQIHSMDCGLAWECNSTVDYNSGTRPNDFIRFNDYIFAVGNFLGVHGENSYGIVYWDGFQWNTFYEGLLTNSGTRGLGLGLSLIENDLYVMGGFDSIADITTHSVFKFNDFANLASVAFPYYESSQRLKCAIQFQEAYYYAGNFNDAETPFDGTIFNIIKYENGQWQPVGQGIRGGMSGVEKMVEFQNKLYVAGVMSKSAGAPGNAIAAWDGEQWDDVGGGLYQQAEAHIYDMQVYNDKLYVVGTFSAAGGVPVNELAVWDGVNWCRMETDVQDYLNRIRAIEFYHDTIYLAGTYSFNVDTIAPERRLIKHLGTLETFQCGNLTSVEQLKTEQIILFPNPSNGIVNLSFGKPVNGKISVNNLMGQLLINESVSGENTTLDLSSFSSGIYFLTFVDEFGNVATEKLVVE